MKSIKYIAFSLGLSALALTSCSDFLDKVPDERTEIDSEDKVVSLLVSAYPEGSPCWLGEMNSDNLIDNQAPHLPSNPNLKQVMAHYNYSQYALWDNQLFRFDAADQAAYSDYDSPGFVWGTYYSSVATANAALKAIDELEANGESSSKLTAAKGEALLIRAYDHFMLVNLFSKAYKNAEASKKDVGVPYVTEPETQVSVNYDRSNVADVYAKIGEDLEAGLKYISNTNFTTAPKYHFNTNAAHAFAARYYLFTHQWQKVIDHADQVLGTDSTSAQKMIVDLSAFSKCSSVSDYANAWQDPDMNNNLMIINTYSLISRRLYGYRYSCAGEAAHGALMIHTNNPLWSGYIAPLQSIVNGSLFGSSTNDYGFFGGKMWEQFQYTDKIAGIGYVHYMYRPFTGNLLLLERAEAKVMLGDYSGAADDLRWFWNCQLNSMSEADYKAYVTANYAKMMTNSVFSSYYSNATHDNCFANWDFTQKMSSDYVIPASAVPYMNCINEFRRWDTVHEGHRYFDIKRWGIDLEHVQGLDQTKYVCNYDDDTRALEVPWEVISAGLESSRPTSSANTNEPTLNPSEFVVTSK